jgi:hypothetical protein
VACVDCDDANLRSEFSVGAVRTVSCCYGRSVSRVEKVRNTVLGPIRRAERAQTIAGTQFGHRDTANAIPNLCVNGGSSKIGRAPLHLDARGTMRWNPHGGEAKPKKELRAGRSIAVYQYHAPPTDRVPRPRGGITAHAHSACYFSPKIRLFINYSWDVRATRAGVRELELGRLNAQFSSEQVLVGLQLWLLVIV